MTVTATFYARSGELSIAWQARGDGPVDLLVVPGLVSHVEAFHELPGYTRLLSRLGAFARVITFDKRGNGLSDRVADAPFSGTIAEIIAVTITSPLPDPRALAPAVPAEIAALVLRMGALDRESRPADGQAAADAIEALL
jgi:hypothetical protein